MQALLSQPGATAVIIAMIIATIPPLIRLAEPMVAWMTESWRDTDPARIERGLEENFLHELFRIRRDYTTTPAQLRKELNMLLQQYRRVPRCIKPGMTMLDMMNTLIHRTQHPVGTFHKEEHPALAEATSR